MATKEGVLAALKASDDYVSGEWISETLGVSRMAVNKAIRALQAGGYEIEAVNRLGYRLLSGPDLLTKEEIAAYLKEERMERVLCLSTTPSTNLKLSELAYEGASDGQVVIADEQTKGRGRRGRGFVSPKGKGIYLSYLMRRKETPEAVSEITAWTAAAMIRAIESCLSARVSVKWVNDLIMNRKKIAGILTELSVESESRQIQSLIIGIGINVNEEREEFPEELQTMAGSILSETGQQVRRAELAAQMIRALDKMNRDFPLRKEEYLRLYRERSLILGESISLSGAEMTGEPVKALAINEDFSLKIQYENSGRTEDIRTGEVSVRGLYGYI